MNNYRLNPEDRAVLSLSELYGKYGYRQYKMSKFEEYDLYVKNKNFLVSDNIITFTDTSGKLMALKPDVTLSIVKNLKRSEDVQKVYYNENVYRVSKGTQSFKEIMQTGLECIGNIDSYTIYEVILLAAKSLKCISDDFVIDISHLGIISSILDSMNISDGGKKELIRCIGEKNLSELSQICESESADPDILKKLVTSYGNIDDVSEILSLPECSIYSKQLTDVFCALKKEGFGKKIHIDFSVVNDINYYNGFVFKGFINGIASGILSGGQYDNLMEKMGRSEKAIGFAVYLDMLERLPDIPAEFDVDTVIIYEDGDDIARISNIINLLSKKGEKVIALKEIPSKIKFRRILKLKDLKKGAESVE